MTVLRKPVLSEIYAPIEKELALFTGALKKELASQDPLIREIHDHLLKMSGKRLRPALTILSSKLEGKTNDEVIKLAVLVELLHTATLIHDDVIDHSDLRRNQPSVFSRWGREISIVSGDYLYAKSFVILASFKNVWLTEAFAECARLMCEGEMKQIEKRNDFLMNEETYLRIIHQKTAALFQAACMGGSYFSGMTKTNVEKMGRYGYNLGMAFQIVDDCLDIIGTTENLGKTTGLDILKNDVTLPVLYLFQSLGETDRRTLFKRMEEATPILFEEIKNLALETRSVDRAMTKAKSYVDDALVDLGGIKNSPIKESLQNLAGHCLDRVR